MAEESISIQSFTRVHMVPRVNQGRTVALAFELPSAPPVAYGAPVQVLQQLFLRIPQVLADAKRVRTEAGLVDAPDAPQIAAVPWVVESVNTSQASDGALILTVQMNSCCVDLSLSAEQVLDLVGLLTPVEKQKRVPKKTSKTVPKVVPEKETSKVATSKKEKPKAKPVAKTSVKTKAAK